MPALGVKKSSAGAHGKFEAPMAYPRSEHLREITGVNRVGVPVHIL
jgi:hypothetical protein